MALLSVRTIREQRPAMVPKIVQAIREIKIEIQLFEEEQRIILNLRTANVHRTIKQAHVDRLI